MLDPSVKGPRRLEGHGVGQLTAEPGLGRRLPRPPGLAPGGPAAGRAPAGGRQRQRVGLGPGRRGSTSGLGAEVVAIGCDPDGTNINDGCGSTATGTLAAAVVEHGADLGLALDGDADRLLAVGRRRGPGQRGRAHRPVRPGPGRTGPAGRQHRGGDGHDQPRLPPGHGGAGDHRQGDRGRRPPRAGRPGQGRALPRRRAVGPHHLPAPGHHRRRAAHRAGPGRPGGPLGQAAHRAARRRGHPGPPGADQRARTQHRAARGGRRGLVGGGRGGGPAGGRRSGRCSGRAAPSPWSG